MCDSYHSLVGPVYHTPVVKPVRKNSDRSYLHLLRGKLRSSLNSQPGPTVPSFYEVMFDFLLFHFFHQNYNNSTRNLLFSEILESNDNFPSVASFEILFALEIWLAIMLTDMRVQRRKQEVKAAMQ